MKFAVPVVNKKLSMHFGHCNEFALVDTDLGKKEIVGTKFVDAPKHEPGLLPSWLQEKGCEVIIAGGMGARAQELFMQKGIKVIIGAPVEYPEKIVLQYLEGNLQSGPNVCDH